MGSKVLKLLTGRYFWVTNTLTAGALRAAGDLIEQGIEFRRERREASPCKVVGHHTGCKQHQTFSVDMPRLGRMFVVGLFQGPVFHVFYSWLDRTIPGRNLRSVGIKVLCDQLLGAPMFISVFFLGMGVLERQSIREIGTEIVEKFPLIYMVDWFVWPPAQFINFYVVPPRWRVVYVSTMLIGWNVFLSWAKHQNVKEYMPWKRSDSSV